LLAKSQMRELGDQNFDWVHALQRSYVHMLVKACGYGSMHR
jgi:hypothetical protein